MAKKRVSPTGRGGNGAALFDELGLDAFSRAFHWHIEELAYEMLKDPDHQAWMQEWMDRFFDNWQQVREKRRTIHKER